MSGKWEEFERELGAWGARPPGVPADAAGRRLVGRLSPRRRRPAWWQLAAAAVLVVAVVVTLRHVSASRRTASPDALPAGFQPADRNTVVWAVDSRTTVVFALGPRGSERGNGS